MYRDQINIYNNREERCDKFEPGSQTSVLNIIKNIWYKCKIIIKFIKYLA